MTLGTGTNMELGLPARVVFTPKRNTRPCDPSLRHPRSSLRGLTMTGASLTNDRRRLAMGLVIGLVVAVGIGGWYFFLRTPRAPKPPVDMLAVLQANNRGIGLMEQFEYLQAIDAFEEVV